VKFLIFKGIPQSCENLWATKPVPHLERPQCFMNMQSVLRSTAPAVAISCVF
jgi:hypothetical protein